MKEVIEVLTTGKTILYPTDTVWGIGCDATNFEAVQKIYKLKNREESKSLIILVDSIEMLKDYVENIPKEVLFFLKKIKEPTTIIYNNPIRLAINTIAIDNTIAIRVVKNKYCQSLIKEFGKPIVSTSANISGEVSPKSFEFISEKIKKGVDYIVEYDENTVNTKPSTILKIMEDGSIITLRK
ncbi:L-threonylcarbamoyladenylate synthase [Tenacibaculum pacificus]|uniref:L-threonylcarbamoyladenylate synthase n=1 Tax=Tenacibaculum pacificus TaxID=3018314 RepID=UPI0022F37E7C|nr:L-threonylcarbamoyladenylate synthase [Tenacibaculum pacificus]WBX74530.1 L-threonylcarbamoyladenylate synthase [Tenacibaculum pacificus]